MCSSQEVEFDCENATPARIRAYIDDHETSTTDLDQATADWRERSGLYDQELAEEEASMQE
jgi:hypothetical protein